MGTCLGSAESAIDGRSKSTNKKAYAAFVLWLPAVRGARVVSRYWLPHPAAE